MQKNAIRKKSYKPRASHKESNPSLSFAKALLQNTGISLCMGLILLVALSLAIYWAPDPMVLIRPAGLGAAAITALFAGARFQKQLRGGILADGMAAGLALMAPMLPLSIALSSFASKDGALISGLLHAALLLFSTAGAWLGEKNRAKPKKKKRR